MFARIFRFLLMLASVLLMIAPLHSAQTAPSKTFNVTSLLDKVDANPGNGTCADNGGNCTLRAAIMEANANPGPDSINLPADTFLLTRLVTGEDAANNGDFDIFGELTINGAGFDKTILDGADLKESLFEIHPSAVVSFTSLTIQNSGYDNNGGGIKNQGELSVTECRFFNNRADHGAGIYNLNGDITISDSIFYDNRANYGGAIYNDHGSTLKLINSKIVDNRAADRAGCIVNMTGDLLIFNSTLSGNRALVIGCIRNQGGVIQVINSTIGNNFAEEHTGGVNQSDGIIYLINTTISGNTGCHSGGGIRISSGTLNAYNSTISENYANAAAVNDRCYVSGVPTYSGGGIKILGGEVSLNNSILANNKVYIAGREELFGDDCSGILSTFSHSLLGTSSGCTITNDNSIADQNAKLGPLIDNGGPTQTHALLEGSPAIDAGDPNGCKDQDGKPLTTDQRGYVRLFDGDGNGTARCDMGAYEVVKDSAFVYLPLLKK